LGVGNERAMSIVVGERRGGRGGGRGRGRGREGGNIIFQLLNEKSHRLCAICLFFH